MTEKKNTHGGAGRGQGRKTNSSKGKENMVRLVALVPPDKKKWLAAQAKKHGVSEGRIVRDVISLFIEEYERI